MRIYKNFIGNQFIEPRGAEIVVVYDPATEEVAGQVFAATSEEAIHAVDVAARAQKTWRKRPGIERARYLQKLADALVARSPEIGQALAQESGKSLSDAVDEAIYAAEITRYHAEWGRRIEGEIIPSDDPSENLLLHREPIGVVACLIPFNYPVYTLLRKIAPALIVGNTVVVRPSDNTPFSAFEIAKAVLDAGIPDGVINILAMSHATAEVMCTHAGVGMITLTGSVAAGRKVLEYSQTNIAKSSLELGGKTPAIIAADADLESAAGEIASSKTAHCGQTCTSVARVYVNAVVYETFVALLKDKLGRYRYGNRIDHPEFMGPLVNAQARRHIHEMVQRAVADGARIELGGFIPEGKGYFYPPTLLTGCRQRMEIIQEEIFGPVLCVLPYETIEEALELPNTKNTLSTARPASN